MLKANLSVKICGLTTKEAVSFSIDAGADMLGFVFFDASPRSITLKKAKVLMQEIPSIIQKVALTVNATDTFLDQLIKNLPVDILQLHGSEKPARISQIKEKFKIPIIKAVPISNSSDLISARHYENIADYLMFDSKPPQNSSRPGGNAKIFDWNILSNVKLSIPWILAGGLNEANVRKAIKISGARAVDVSSGVENAPGIKDQEKIDTFVKTVRSMKQNL